MIVNQLANNYIFLNGKVVHNSSRGMLLSTEKLWLLEYIELVFLKMIGFCKPSHKLTPFVSFEVAYAYFE